MNLNNDEIRSLEERVKKSPGSPAFARLADYYRSTGHVDNAIALCETGVKAHPEYSTGHLLLGRCYFEKERVDDARQEFETVLKLDRKNVFALKIVGDIEAQKGEKTKAARYYKLAADFDPLNLEVQAMFRQFAQFYKPETASPPPAQPETVQPIESAPAETPLPAGPSPAVETAMEPLNAGPAETEMLDIAGAQGFDDLEKATATPSVPEPLPEPETAAANAPEPVEPEPASLPDTQGYTGVESLMEPGEEAPAPLAEPEPLELPVSQPAPPENTDAPDIETEMVDLPPEMTGAKEARVGDFRIRKSLFDRLLDEQHGLFEEVSERGTLVSPAVEQAETEETALALPETDDGMNAGPATTPRVPAVQPEISSSAAGMDGFFNVEGSSTDGAGDVALAGIDDVEIDGVVDDETPTRADDTLETVEAPSTVEEPEEIVEIPVAETPADGPVEPATALSDNGFAEDILADMDVDDDLKSFATQAAAAQSSPVPEAPQPEKATLPVPEPKPDPAAEENPPQPVFTQPPSSGISASAAGMDGFFNVEGAASDAEGEVGLSGIDKVEINGIVDDESLPAGNESEQTVGTTVAAEMETAEPADTASRGDGPLELGADVEFEIPLVIKPVLQAEKTADSRPSATPPEPVEDAPFKTAEPKKPKAKTPPRVVSNVATSSLADIYLRQGHKEQALAVYKKMLEQKPDNKRILAKIEKLEKELENED